jgi:hypothetical protein
VLLSKRLDVWCANSDHIVGHYPSAFGLAYVICTAIHCHAPFSQCLVVSQRFKKWPLPLESPQKLRLLFFLAILLSPPLSYRPPFSPMLILDAGVTVIIKPS